MTNTLKLSLLGGATVLAVTIPVSAGQHNGLRGMFAPQAPAVYQQQYVAPQSWQAQRLYNTQAPQAYHQPAQYVAGGYVSGGYVPVQHTTYGVAQNNYVQTQQGLQLRGFSNPHAVSYSRNAANAFHADRKRAFNMGGVSVRTSSLHSRDMLDIQENVTGKTLTLLANRANGVLQENSLYLGGNFQGAFMYQKTSDAGKFPILSRFPFFSSSGDTEAGVFAINSASLAFTSTFGDWTTVFLQPEYSETEYPGEQDEFQLRKAYVVFGNLERSPFYAAFGRKNIDFGNFDSYNAFTQNEGQHYFNAHSDQPVVELGFYNNGWKFTGSAFSGGRQLRVAYADEENNIGNYAFNAEKEFRFGGSSAFTIGGGYLHDTIYRNNWTAHTFAGINTGTPPTNLIEYRNIPLVGV